MLQEICKILLIKKTCTTPYDPQSNDLAERFNRTLLNMITACLAESIQLLMLNVLEYFWMKGKIQELLQTEQTDFVRGSISILFQRYTENEFILNHSIAVIQGFVDIPISMLSASESKCQSDADDVLADYDYDDSINSSDSDVDV